MRVGRSLELPGNDCEQVSGVEFLSQIERLCRRVLDEKFRVPGAKERVEIEALRELDRPHHPVGSRNARMQGMDRVSQGFKARSKGLLGYGRRERFHQVFLDRNPGVLDFTQYMYAKPLAHLDEVFWMHPALALIETLPPQFRKGTLQPGVIIDRRRKDIAFGQQALARERLFPGPDLKVREQQLCLREQVVRWRYQVRRRAGPADPVNEEMMEVQRVACASPQLGHQTCFHPRPASGLQRPRPVVRRPSGCAGLHHTSDTRHVGRESQAMT